MPSFIGLGNVSSSIINFLNLSAFIDLDYYSKHGFRPHYGFVNSFKGVDLTIEQGKFQDGDDEWIKKKHEFRLNFHPQKVFDLPWHYSVNLSRGKWEDSEKESWHDDYNIYFRTIFSIHNTQTIQHSF